MNSGVAGSPGCLVHFPGYGLIYLNVSKWCMRLGCRCVAAAPQRV